MNNLALVAVVLCCMAVLFSRIAHSTHSHGMQYFSERLVILAGVVWLTGFIAWCAS